MNIHCTAFDKIETNSFDGVDGGYDSLTEEEPERPEVEDAGEEVDEEAR